MLPALVEAGESSLPVLAFNSDVGVSSRGQFSLTELDMKNLFVPVTKWNDVVDAANEIAPKIRAAFRNMTTGISGSLISAFRLMFKRLKFMRLKYGLLE